MADDGRYYCEKPEGSKDVRRKVNTMLTWGHLRVTLSTAMTVLLAGCLVIPVGLFTEDPYSEEKLAPLRTPNADRSLVRQKFGAPAYTKEKQRYWFYTNQRATVGVIGGSSHAVFTDDDWLLVEFDQNGKVVFVEATDFGKCTSNGVCMDGSVPADSSNSPVHSRRTNENECSVYLYLNKLPWPLPTGSVRYYIDGKPIGIVNSETYLFLTHPQGNIEISAYDLSILTHCDGGKSLYIRAVKKADWSWKTGEDLAPADEVEGEMQIRLRKPSLHD